MILEAKFVQDAAAAWLQRFRAASAPCAHWVGAAARSPERNEDADLCCATPARGRGVADFAATAGAGRTQRRDPGSAAWGLNLSEIRSVVGTEPLSPATSHG